MARQRTKSINDITEQARRLYLDAIQGGNQERAMKVLDIYTRYNNNIKETKASHNYDESARRKYESGDFDGFSSDVAKRDSKQWARSTYMTGKTGNNGG